MEGSVPTQETDLSRKSQDWEMPARLKLRLWPQQKRLQVSRLLR